MAKGILKVKIIGDARDLSGALKSAHKDVSDFGHKAAGALKAGLLVGGGAAVAGLGLIIKTGISEFSDYQKGLAQANAVIKSTGGVAGVTSKHIEDMASSLQAATGATDDSVVAGENLLLTFTNIQNKAGKGNDIFDQATRTILDMSQALGQDTSTSAIQLGKALNDPIKGVTALRRVGVSFTQDQLKQIKALQASGHTMQAQKLILGELNREFGGSAKAFGDTLPGKLQKAKRAFEDMSQSVISVVAPAFTMIIGGVQKLIAWIGPILGTAVKAMFGGFDEGVGTDQGGLVGFFANVGNAAYGFIQLLKTDVIPVVKEVLGAAFKYLGIVIQTLVPVFKAVFQFIAANVIPILKGIGHFIADVVYPALSKLVTIIGGALLSVFHTINRVIDQHRGQFEKLGNFLKVVIGFIVRDVVPVIGFVLGNAFRIAGGILGIFIGVIGDVIGAFGHIKNAVGDAINFLKTVFIDGIQIIANIWLGFISIILHGAAAAFGWIPGLGGKLKKARNEFDKFKNGVNAALDAIKNPHKTITAHWVIDPKQLAAVRATDPHLASIMELKAGYAKGGEVGKGLPRGAPVPILAHAGEYVLTIAETARAKAFRAGSGPMARGGDGPAAGTTYNVTNNIYNPVGRSAEEDLAYVHQRIQLQLGA